MADTILRYSHSALRTQATCPARRYFKRLAKEGKIETDPALPLVFGIAVHEAIETRLKTGRNPFDTFGEFVQKELLDKFPANKLDIDAITDRQKDMERCIRNFERDFYPNLFFLLGDNPEDYLEVTLEAPYRKGVLIGKMDVILPNGVEAMSDWKTGETPYGPGSKPPARAKAMKYLVQNTQSPIYYRLAKLVDIPPPRKFNFVFLQGVPTKKSQVIDPETKKPAFLKSGKNKGQPKMEWDKVNDIQYTFPVFQDDDSVAKTFRNVIDPLAKLYEDDVLYKDVSALNCGTCAYRTACPDYDLPEATLPQVLPTIQAPPPPTPESLTRTLRESK